MDLLTEYSNSESDTSRSSQDKPLEGSAEQQPLNSRIDPHNETSEDDSDASSSDQSVDSATLRAAEAESRLRDYGKTAPAATSLLPSAASAFDEVDGPPAFLDPAATRKLATMAHHGRANEQQLEDATSSTWHGPRGTIPPGEKFDIARLAPTLKGEPRAGKDKRGIPYSAVIEGKAKRVKTEDGVEDGQQYSAAQIAMLGGNVLGKGAPSKPMPVAEFLNKGLGAAQLPRKAQDRKDKEKNKRGLGQSSIGEWKSEAEMVLRQQYD